MYCPDCHHPNPADAEACLQCRRPTRYLREHIYFGGGFVFARADEQKPIALKVDDAVRTCRAPTILSLHRHAVGFGDQASTGKKNNSPLPLPDRPRQPAPVLRLLTVITDRKIYKPGTEAGVFIIAPDACEQEAALEIRLAGQKVYEAKVPLSRDGLALHRYADFKEGEYTVGVSTPDKQQAECTFSAAEFSLSPLIATLDRHEYAQKRLKFALNLLVLSRPYSGPVEFGLQCQVCGDRIVATQKTKANNGRAEGDFDLSSHGGPFHVQVTTPDGHTALVSFPGTGAQEREHIRVNSLGQTVDAGLLPWQGAAPLRGLYLGTGEMNTTPLLLDSVIAQRGRLKVAGDLPLVQVVTINPRTGETRTFDYAGLKRGAEIEFEVDAPYTFFWVAAFTQDDPFTGWGVVFRPLAFDAHLTAPQTARPGEEIDVHIRLSSLAEGSGMGAGARCACLLLVYDARLEHESPLPKLAKSIYHNIQSETRAWSHAEVTRASDYPSLDDRRFLPDSGAMPTAAMPAPMMRAREEGGVLRKAAALPLGLVGAAAEGLAGALTRSKTEAQALTLVVAPARMEFPELVHLELFYAEGEAARTVRLGDQIGTWRVRAYVIGGVDVQELTADVQVDKPLYAEIDAPAIASDGDDITASVNYSTRSPADLVITTLFGETRVKVNGSGAQTFAVKGPGKVDVRIENESSADWSVREVARPGVQTVTASQLMILDTGQTARGEKVVAYASPAHVLKDTIDALLRYPFG